MMPRDSFVIRDGIGGIFWPVTTAGTDMVRTRPGAIGCASDVVATHRSAQHNHFTARAHVKDLLHALVGHFDDIFDAADIVCPAVGRIGIEIAGHIDRLLKVDAQAGIFREF